VADDETAGIMSSMEGWGVLLYPAMTQREWAGMLLEVVFLPRDSFLLPDGLLKECACTIRLGCIGGLD